MKNPATVHRASHDTRAYVLIDTEPEMTARVVRNLRHRDDILMADAVNGPHSAIAVVEGRNASEVATTILMTIRKLDGVRDLTVYTAAPHSTAPAAVSD